MKKIASAGAICAALLAGCKTAPVGPQNREQWQALHTRTLTNVSEKQVLDAAQQVLALADHDFKFDYPEHRLEATRKWSIYMVLTFTMGTDYWRISTAPSGNDVKVSVEISRAAGAFIPTPAAGVTGPGAGGVGISGSLSMMPGENVASPFPYELFWSRLNYLLNKSGHWTTCAEATHAKHGTEKRDSDVLCGVTTDDKSPMGMDTLKH